MEKQLMRSLNTLLLLFLASALALPAAAQQMKQVGDYEVHYNTINTNQLTPEIASAYGIQRAGTQAMLNITVLDKDTRAPLEAEVSAIAINLTGQRRDIELRQIKDQGAVYHIGQFRIHEEESLNFKVQVDPEGHDGAPFELEFRQQFFTG